MTRFDIIKHETVKYPSMEYYLAELVKISGKFLKQLGTFSKHDSFMEGEQMEIVPMLQFFVNKMGWLERWKDFLEYGIIYTADQKIFSDNRNATIMNPAGINSFDNGNMKALGRSVLGLQVLQNCFKAYGTFNKTDPNSIFKSKKERINFEARLDDAFNIVKGFHSSVRDLGSKWFKELKKELKSKGSKESEIKALTLPLRNTTGDYDEICFETKPSIRHKFDPNNSIYKHWIKKFDMTEVVAVPPLSPPLVVVETEEDAPPPPTPSKKRKLVRGDNKKDDNKQKKQRVQMQEPIVENDDNKENNINSKAETNGSAIVIKPILRGTSNNSAKNKVFAATADATAAAAATVKVDFTVAAAAALTTTTTTTANATAAAIAKEEGKVNLKAAAAALTTTPTSTDDTAADTTSTTAADTAAAIAKEEGKVDLTAAAAAAALTTTTTSTDDTAAAAMAKEEGKVDLKTAAALTASTTTTDDTPADPEVIDLSDDNEETNVSRIAKEVQKKNLSLSQVVADMIDLTEDDDDDEVTTTTTTEPNVWFTFSGKHEGSAVSSGDYYVATVYNSNREMILPGRCLSDSLVDVGIFNHLCNELPTETKKKFFVFDVVNFASIANGFAGSSWFKRRKMPDFFRFEYLVFPIVAKTHFSLICVGKPGCIEKEWKKLYGLNWSDAPETDDDPCVSIMHLDSLLLRKGEGGSCHKYLVDGLIGFLFKAWDRIHHAKLLKDNEVVRFINVGWVDNEAIRLEKFSTQMKKKYFTVSHCPQQDSCTNDCGFFTIEAFKALTKCQPASTRGNVANEMKDALRFEYSQRSVHAVRKKTFPAFCSRLESQWKERTGASDDANMLVTGASDDANMLVVTCASDDANMLVVTGASDTAMLSASDDANMLVTGASDTAMLSTGSDSPHLMLAVSSGSSSLFDDIFGKDDEADKDRSSSIGSSNENDEDMSLLQKVDQDDQLVRLTKKLVHAEKFTTYDNDGAILFPDKALMELSNKEYSFDRYVDSLVENISKIQELQVEVETSTLAAFVHYYTKERLEDSKLTLNVGMIMFGCNSIREVLKKKHNDKEVEVTKVFDSQLRYSMWTSLRTTALFVSCCWDALHPPSNDDKMIYDEDEEEEEEGEKQSDSSIKGFLKAFPEFETILTNSSEEELKQLVVAAGYYTDHKSFGKPLPVVTSDGPISKKAVEDALHNLHTQNCKKKTGSNRYLASKWKNKWKSNTLAAGDLEIATKKNNHELYKKSHLKDEEDRDKVRIDVYKNAKQRVTRSQIEQSLHESRMKTQNKLSNDDDDGEAEFEGDNNNGNVTTATNAEESTVISVTDADPATTADDRGSADAESNGKAGVGGNGPTLTITTGATNTTITGDNVECNGEADANGGNDNAVTIHNSVIIGTDSNKLLDEIKPSSNEAALLLSTRLQELEAWEARLKQQEEEAKAAGENKFKELQMKLEEMRLENESLKAAQMQKKKDALAYKQKLKERVDLLEKQLKEKGVVVVEDEALKQDPEEV